jgi:predicted MFS family arabinose efflux permease
MAALVVTTISLEFGYISAIPLMTELRPRARTRVLGLSTVASALGRIASDFISPRVFAARGMEMVTIMAGTVALVALVVVLGWAREVSPGERVAAAREG